MFFIFPEKFAEKSLQLFVPNSKRLKGYTQCQKFLQEHFRVSLRKLPGSILFLPERTWRNKKASEFNHELLGGLLIQGL
jgi:hypothetical protein